MVRSMTSTESTASDVEAGFWWFWVILGFRFLVLEFGSFGVLGFRVLEFGSFGFRGIGFWSLGLQKGVVLQRLTLTV